MARKLEVEIIGDASKLHKELGKATDQTGRFGKGLGGLQKVAGMAAGAAGVGAFVGALKSTIDAAAASEVSQKKMATQLKALGISYGAHAKEIDKVIQKTSQLSGLDDEDLQDSFTNIVRTTGNVSQALKLTGLAADFARAKHIEVAKAGEIVAKVAGGNTGILARYGVTIEKGASSTEALGALQAKFAGQAEAYGKTTAGAQDRFRVATENLQEAIGSKLLPIVTKITTAATDFIIQMQNGEGAGGKFRKALKDIGDTFDAIWNAMQPLVAAVLPGLVRQLTGFGASIHGVLMIIRGIFKGDFGLIWDGVKEIFRGAIDTLLGRLQAAVAPFKSAGRALGNAVIGGIKSLLEDFQSAGTWVTDRIANAVKTVTDSMRSVGVWIKDRIVNQIKGLVADFADLGGWIVDNLVRGIKMSTKAISDAASWLKDQMVSAVKKFFGISSPSKVMMELGGHLATGLIRGVVGGDIAGFIKAHFSGIGDLAQTLVSSGWEGLKNFFGGQAKSGSMGVGGPIVGNALAWLTTALKLTGHYSQANLNALYGRMMQESGGNPRAINLTDSNAAAGHPSKGLLQTIESTFAAYRLKSLPNDIWNPIANAAAAIRYMYAVYGHIVGPSSTGYAGGTSGAARGWHWVGERGPELVNFAGGETVLSNGRSVGMGAGQVIVQHHYHGPVIQDKQFLNYARNAERGFARQNGKSALGA